MVFGRIFRVSPGKSRFHKAADQAASLIEESIRIHGGGHGHEQDMFGLTDLPQIRFARQDILFRGGLITGIGRVVPAVRGIAALDIVGRNHSL